MKINNYLKVVGVFGFALLLGCGGSGSSNNVQNEAVSHIGYYQDVPAAGSTDLPLGDTGTNSTVADITTEGYSTFIGFQNNLSQQAFRMDQLNYRFEIPGSNLAPPPTSRKLTFVMGPFVSSDSEDAGEFDSSLPPGFDILPELYIAGVRITPPETIDWLQNNIGSLTTPFQIIVYVSGQGVAIPSGDFYETEAAPYIITFAE